MGLWERLRVLHRAWRYRLRTERRELGFLLRQDLRGATVVDVGANRGVYSYWMHSLVGPTGRVVAYEPQPELAKYLRELKRDFGLNRLTIEEYGLSSVAGPKRLLRPIGHWGAASFHLPDRDDLEMVEVSATTLDERIDALGVDRVAFIKCDVQDHELDVFRGAERTLRRDRPTLLFESEDEVWETGRLRSFLEDLGYAGGFFFQGTIAPAERFDELRPSIQQPYLNFVYSPIESIAGAA